MKEILSTFDSKDHTLILHPQIQKLEPDDKDH